ncbi:hypothetical protein Hanom_Chr03g00247551 [Helianthus anomalus]
MVFKDYTKYLNNYNTEIEPKVYYIFIQSAHFEKRISSNKLPVKRVMSKRPNWSTIKFVFSVIDSIFSH